MRKIIAVEYLSVDGIMSDPAWTAPYWNDELAGVQGALLSAADTLLLGRVTYEGMSGAWTTTTTEAEEDKNEMNTLPKLVPTATLDTLTWNATPLRGDVYGEIERAKRQPGKNLLIYGSGMLVRSLLERGLIDELHLIVCPVVVGEGRRLFSEGNQAKLHLAGVQTTATGVVVLTYRPETNSGA